MAKSRQKRTPEQGVPQQAAQALHLSLGERLISVVLFGSRARGDARESSDWDLFVIAEGLPERPFERHLFLKRILPSHLRAEVSVLAKTPQEFAARLTPLYLDIALDGRILYDPQRYAAGRLASLRRKIKRIGLNREKTEAGDVWRWEKQPTGRWALDWER